MLEVGIATFRHINAEIKRVKVAASAANANAIVAAPGAGLKIVLLSSILSASGAVNAKWQSADTDKTGLFYFAAAGQTVQSQVTVECAANQALNLHLSGAVAVGGNIEYIVVRSSL